MQLGAAFLWLDIYCLDWTFFLWTKKEKKWNSPLEKTIYWVKMLLSAWVCFCIETHLLVTVNRNYLRPLQALCSAKREELWLPVHILAAGTSASGWTWKLIILAGGRSSPPGPGFQVSCCCLVEGLICNSCKSGGCGTASPDRHLIYPGDSCCRWLLMQLSDGLSSCGYQGAFCWK